MPPNDISHFTFHISLTGSRIVHLRSYSALVEALKLPTYLKERDTRLKEAIDNAPFFFRFRWTFTSRLAQWDRVRAAHLAASRALVAVERYRVLHRSWPDALTDLVPGVVSELPPDPFDGRPLRYRHVQDGIVVYSVGSNLMDDGGNLTPPKPGVDPLDIGFRLYDIAKRRSQ